MKLLLVVGIALGTTYSAVGAEDPASVLAQILAEKGTISSAERARVESAATPDKTAMLASILADKGILLPADLARLKNAATPAGSSAAPPPVTVASTPPMPIPKAPAPPKVGEGPAIVSEGKSNISVYGTLLLNAFSNTSLTNIEDIPLLAGKQGSDALGNDKSFGMTARQSRIGLKFKGPEVAGAKVSGQAEIDFLGGKAAFANGINMDLVRLRLAFGRMDWKNFSIEGGQDWSVFAPLNPTTYAEYAIPGLSASGNPWIRQPQFRVEFHGNVNDAARLKFQLAAVDPNMGDYNTTVFSSGRTPDIGARGRFPGVESRLALATGPAGQEYEIGLSSHYARGKNTGAVGANIIQTGVDSWGTAIDYSLPFTKSFNLSGEWYVGRALGIFSVASGEAVLPVDTPAGSHGVEARGGWSQAQVNFTKKWQANLGYGIDAERNKNLRVGDRNKNQTYFGNIIYKYNPHLTFAWELRRFETGWKAQPLANEQGMHANMAVVYTF